MSYISRICCCHIYLNYFLFFPSLKFTIFVPRLISNCCKKYVWLFPDNLGRPHSISARFLQGIEKLLRGKLSNDWTEAPGLMPFTNGVLDINTMKLLPHSHNNFLKWILPYEYNPVATCHPIDKWFKSQVSDDGTIEVLRAYLYAIATGKYEWEQYLELIGKGGTGKGTFTRLAQALIGIKNAHSTRLQRLEKSPFEPASLKNKRLCVITDKSWNPTTGCNKVSPGCLHCYKVFDVIYATSRHTYQILTKRPERLVELAPHLDFHKNIWLGVSVENQNYVSRIDLLRQVPANVRFLSCEPLLGPLNLDFRNIDWVIVGGESGQKHRLMNIEWAKDIRDQCQKAEVAFFFKQVGGKTSKAGGTLLDGRKYLEFPQC
ncbi:MAG: DUF5131 family protein [Aphanizomenon sp.]